LQLLINIDQIFKSAYETLINSIFKNLTNNNETPEKKNTKKNFSIDKEKKKEEKMNMKKDEKNLILKKDEKIKVSNVYNPKNNSSFEISFSEKKQIIPKKFNFLLAKKPVDYNYIMIDNKFFMKEPKSKNKKNERISKFNHLKGTFVINPRI
jgi:hypothetical protein